MTVIAPRQGASGTSGTPSAPAPLAPLAVPVLAVRGDHLLIRPALPCDVEALVAMHDRCSLDTRIARWHAPIRRIPASYLAEVTGCAATHPAVVANRTAPPYDLVGLASACLVSPEAWELGMLVEDAFQRQGVGRAMLRVLVEEVVRRGGRELLAVSLEERRSVLRSLRGLGTVTFSARATTVTAHVLLRH